MSDEPSRLYSLADAFLSFSLSLSLSLSLSVYIYLSLPLSFYIFISGHLWAMMVREKLGEWLRSLSAALSRDEGDPVEKTFAAAVRKATERVDIGKV